MANRDEQPPLRSRRHGSDEYGQCPTERDAGRGRGSACRCSRTGSLAVLLGAVAVLEHDSCGGRWGLSPSRRIGRPQSGTVRQPKAETGSVLAVQSGFPLAPPSYAEPARRSGIPLQGPEVQSCLAGI